MKLPKDFPNLDDLLKRLGVPFQPFIDTEKEKLIIGPGITVGPDDVKVAPNGTLEYQGRKVVLYIRDVRGRLPKYHVVDCQTLKDMRDAGKYKRYVVTRRTDGEFLLNFADNLRRDNPDTYRLDICKNCLWQELNLKDVYTPDAFPLDDWFNAIDGSYEPPPRDGLLGPKTTPTTGTVSNYPPDWNLISLQCRKRAGWKCEECGIFLNLKTERKFLHAHHLRGTSHNRPEDLKALCVGCHAEQPGHNTNLPNYQEFMDKYGDIWKELRKQ
ncbi:hypothetical protein C6501_01655 [Candidatus Poribacteria bacterium]|nr:MAG: hypothetical protein C6501_01655 [Candidatus Poribacteria bacterium]